MIKRLAMGAALLAALGGGASAQSTDRIRGAVASLDGTALRVAASGGGTCPSRSRRPTP